MTNNKRNINHTRFVRKEKKEIKEENDHDLAKEDPRRKEIANLNRGKFFCRKIWTQLHQKGRKETQDWGKIFLSKNFG